MLLAVGSVLTVSADELPLIQNVNAYESCSLNGEWNYIVDVQEEGYYDYRMNPTAWGFFRNAKPQRPEDLIEYDFDKSPREPYGLRRVSMLYLCRIVAPCCILVQ